MFLCRHTQETAAPQQVEEDILYDLGDLARHAALLHLAGADAGQGRVLSLHPGLRDSVRTPGRHLQSLQHLTSGHVIMLSLTRVTSPLSVCRQAAACARWC